MTYKVLVTQGLERRYEIVEAPDIETAESVSGGVVVFMLGPSR